MDYNALFRVDGMVAVITGGGTGIGLAMAKALATHGAAKVYILGRRLNVLEDAAKGHPNIIPHQCDVTSKEDLQAAVDRVTKEVGYVNLVVANSGVVGPSVRYNPSLSVSELRKVLFTDFSMQDMTDVLHVNVTAAFFTMSAFLELLDAGNKNALKGGFGKPDKEGSDVVAIQSQVIFTSSISAYSRHYASSPPYMASKVAIMHITKHASSQLGRLGIRANGLAPGLFPSDIAAGMIGDRKPENEATDDERFIPARRFGGDEEMAGTILYLAGRSGSYCNGSIMVTDGGRLSLMPGTY
ncbi:short chain dehydrogenase [Colletotrichum eremochloae]|uniref:Putative short chain dehydrogenase n=1 Tax=Colletotrichum sublineola TaxID=1173701 RepID=A0A066XTY3_COLSU|nr:short chain dehydrogenase [Colletotrichum sublineola]KAK2015978.1 short chain dehydrogenase [Colletotrichum eremochloae]KDN69201.1 putative short chain dehydrogenase [Colletotrichum sublineola]